MAGSQRRLVPGRNVRQVTPSSHPSAGVQGLEGCRKEKWWHCLSSELSYGLDIPVCPGWPVRH